MPNQLWMNQRDGTFIDDALLFQNLLFQPRAGGLAAKGAAQKKLVRSVIDAINRQMRTNRSRTVLYHAPELDLTDDLIKYLKGK